MQDTPFCYRKNSRGLFKICEKEANPTSKCWQASHLMQWKTHYWNLPKTWVLFQPLILILLNWGRTHSEQPQWSDCSKPRPLLSTLLWNTSYRNGVARLDGGWQHLHTKHKGVWDQFNGFSHLSLQAPPNTFLLKGRKKKNEERGCGLSLAHLETEIAVAATSLPAWVWASGTSARTLNLINKRAPSGTESRIPERASPRAALAYKFMLKSVSDCVHNSFYKAL